MMHELADALNHASHDFEVGRLQQIRVGLRSLTRAPSRAIFGAQTTLDTYAFHIGGRTELQFNIGTESLGGSTQIRHGLAFSLEPSQTLPTLDPLLPKIARFNHYIRSHPEDFPGFRMWHHGASGRSEDLPIGAIPDELIRPGNFIVLGRYVPAGRVQVSTILADFDRLLPLYVFVESTGDVPTPLREGEPFRPGCPSFAEHSTASLPERTIDVALRHAAMQSTLHILLREEAGEDNVCIEHTLSYGSASMPLCAGKAGSPSTRLRSRRPCSSAFGLRSACARPALGQLLEYAHWRSADRAQELIVVGEAEITDDALAYLRPLRERFAIPLWYRRLDLARAALGPRV